MQCADLEIVSCSDQMSCSDHVIEHCNLIGAYRVLVFCYLITGTVRSAVRTWTSQCGARAKIARTCTQSRDLTRALLKRARAHKRTLNVHVRT